MCCGFSLLHLFCPLTSQYRADEKGLRSVVVLSSDEHTLVPPEQLNAMIDLLRDTPVCRLKIGPSVVRQIDKREPLLAVADFALHATARQRRSCTNPSPASSSKTGSVRR